MLRGVLILVLVACLTAVPVQLNTNNDQVLIRIKRDAPDSNVAGKEAKELDKKAEISVETQPAENKDVSPDLVEEPETNEGEATETSDVTGQTGDATQDVDATTNAQKEQAVNKIFDEDNSNERTEKEKLVDKIMSEDDEKSENLDPDYQEFMRDYIRNYLPYTNGPYRRKRTVRPRAVTAEQMGRSQLKLKLRRKRDLDITPEELEYLLEAEGALPQEEEEGPLEEYEEAVEPEINAPVEYSPQEEYGSEGDALANAELLNYLYQNSPNEADDTYLPPEDVRESWEEYLPEDKDTEEVVYEPIVHEGTPGIFIPIGQKRQYLSMIPGNRRKRNFYPADDSLTGRWGAFISDQRAVKRANAYDRLYELAEQLRGSPFQQDYYNKK